MGFDIIKAVNGATEMVNNLPFEAFQKGGDNKVSMTRMVSNIKKFGTAPDNAFSLEIYASNIKGDINKRIFYTCESFSFPGNRFETEDIVQGGPNRKKPYKKTYTGEFAATFRLGKDFYERKLFEDWQKLMYDEELDTWGFPVDYMGTIVLRQFNESNENIYGVKFNEVYPIAVTEIPVDQNNKGAPLKQNITFSYRKWERLGDEELLDAPSGLPFGVPLINGFIGKDLSNLITSGMNLASAVNNQIGNLDKTLQDNAGFIRRAVNGQVIRSPYENIGTNLNQIISRYSGSNFFSF